MSSLTRPKICSNLLSSATLRFNTSSIHRKSHYDTLGVTSKATQNDIKSAYYKLTKIYHPDKNSTEEAKAKFRNITNAYEILGNYKSRKMYDRGMRPGLRYENHESEEDRNKEDAQTRFYKSRFTRTRAPAPSGRTPIYDFDEWAKAHYGELFNQQLKVKETIQYNEQYQRERELTTHNAKIVLPMVLIFFMVSLTLATDMNRDYDRNRLTSDEKAKRSS